ncbi:MAG: UDP-N-acetylmuramate dehydrogenase [Gammaproteobacteria bacterium]|nr:UDP-N-acetylmuramate dehydrogenase [Gammaproteobacteria bacterium]MDH3466516.1 UDP-N-acetylmuramate dehydrogenase [Gammaproteobacteria bacterium]
MGSVCRRWKIDAPADVAGRLSRNEPMARHTSWRAGGSADLMYNASDLADLVRFLRQLPVELPILWLGLGSNLLVRDGGFRGVVIATQKALTDIARPEPSALRVGAGVTGAKLARFAVRAGLSGAEFLAGIPGTLGGALAMNAGAFGFETWNLVRSVQTIDRHGAIRERVAREYRIGYRSVTGPPGEWFTAAQLQFVRNFDDSTVSIKELLAKRGASQPVQSANAGSVFRNPPGDYAARLIEAAGLKGARCGNAMVSTQHANFVVNTGGATAHDIEQLITRLQRRVREHSGVELETEVKIVGESAIHAKC